MSGKSQGILFCPLLGNPEFVSNGEQDVTEVVYLIKHGRKAAM